MKHRHLKLLGHFILKKRMNYTKLDLYFLYIHYEFSILNHRFFQESSFLELSLSSSFGSQILTKSKELRIFFLHWKKKFLYVFDLK